MSRLKGVATKIENQTPTSLRVRFIYVQSDSFSEMVVVDDNIVMRLVAIAMAMGCHA